MKEKSMVKQSATVLGIGKAGTRIAEALFAMEEAKWLKIGAADSDSSTMDTSELPNLFPVGIEWTQGLGCGGEVIKGERAFAHSIKDSIEGFFEGSSMIIITGGMGGGTATGGASVLARFAKKMNIPSVFLVTIPFSFEGHNRRMIAEKEIKSLVQDADIVLPIPNDILYSTLKSDTSAEEAFAKANGEMARAIIGIADIVRAKNLLSADFSDLKSALNKRKTICGIGIGRGSRDDGDNKCIVACERLMESPLLGGIEQIKKADAVLVSVSGGENISIGEMRLSLDIIQRYTSEKTRLIAGVSGDKLYDGRLQMTMVTVHYDLSAEDNTPDIYTPAINNETPLGQQADGQQFLPLKSYSRGIFTNSSRNMFFGMDLDIPTFERMDIHIDTGKR